MSKSYFCHDCNRGFQNDDIQHHPCEGRWCHLCQRKDCPEFHAKKASLPEGKDPTPTERCDRCNRDFYGDDCYTHHLISSSNKQSLCDIKKKCKICYKIYEATTRQVKDKSKFKKHKCEWECPFCEKQVELEAHQCFIQPAKKEDDEPKLKKVPLSEVGTRAIICTDEDRSVWVERPPPLFVYADFKAVTGVLRES